MINISMCRQGKDWGCHPCNFPIIGCGIISLGQLIFHNAYRLPADPVWLIETIGL